GLVIEEVHFHAGNAQIVAALEKLVARLWSPNTLGVLPHPDADMTLLGIAHQLLDLGIAPAGPKPFNDVVLESQLAGQARELLHFLESAFAAIQVLPHGSTGLDPLAMKSLGEELRVRRRAKIVDHITVYQRVQVAADHYDPPWCRDRSDNCGGLGQSFGFL